MPRPASNKHLRFSSDVENDWEDNQASQKWFEQIEADPPDFKKVTDQILIELKEEAKKCYDAEAASYKIKSSKTNSNYKWIKTVMSKGVISDKIAASTVQIQDNPMCSLDILETLVNMVKVGKKKECIMVMETLTELFLSDLLKPNAMLKLFSERPLSLINELSSGNAVTRRKLLTAWYFEDQLKQLFKNFVFALNAVAQDVLDTNKEKAISSMYKLLANNPEQEQNLLKFIVNKLGDPSQKVGSKAIYSLSQLLFKHPNMQGVVLTEVEKLLFRPNVSQKTQYYGLCFLSQFYLSHEASDVARRVIEVYFSFFKSCIKKGEVDSRMMSALLMGVNRAYPYAKLELNKISEHIDTIYRVVHIASFNISLHALSLLFQVSKQEKNISDRFYSALYKKLIDPHLLTTTHQAMLLNLIHKAIMNDNQINRVVVFLKRLLQLVLFMQPAFACGILYIISQILAQKAEARAFILKQNVAEDDEEKYKDVVAKEEEDVKPDINVLNRSLNQASWDHCAIAIKSEKKVTNYNALHRNPLYAGGEFCTYTELNFLKNHFHPSVALYATNILEGTLIKYSGDPLKDFTLIKFLDRFVYKNPKRNQEIQGAHPTFGRRKLYVAKGVRALPVNSRSYLEQDLGKIPVDELFMHSYLRSKFARRSKDEDEESDVESVASDEFEEMLDKMAGLPKDDEDLDFLNEVKDNLKKKPKKTHEDEEDISDDNDDEDVSDEELDDFDDDDLEMDDDDKELLDDLDDEDDEELVFNDEKPNKKKKKSSNSVFASAEEFATLLEDEGSSKVAPGGSNVFANADKASVKQIAWEEKRNRWLHGFDKAVGKNKKKDFANKRRKNQNNSNAKKRKNKV